MTLTTIRWNQTIKLRIITSAKMCAVVNGKSYLTLHVTDADSKTRQTGDFASSERQLHKRKSSFRSQQQFLSILLVFNTFI